MPGPSSGVVRHPHHQLGITLIDPARKPMELQPTSRHTSTCGSSVVGAACSLLDLWRILYPNADRLASPGRHHLRTARPAGAHSAAVCTFSANRQAMSSSGGQQRHRERLACHGCVTGRARRHTGCHRSAASIVHATYPTIFVSSTPAAGTAGTDAGHTVCGSAGAGTAGTRVVGAARAPLHLSTVWTSRAAEWAHRSCTGAGVPPISGSSSPPDPAAPTPSCRRGSVGQHT